MKKPKKLILILIVGGILLGGGAIVAINLGSSGSINLQKGLVGHWTFDGDVKDKTPYLNHGTVAGASLAIDRKEKPDKAYSLDGLNDYIEAPHSDSLSINGNLTVLVWAKLDDQGGANNWLVSYSEWGGLASDNHYYTLGVGEVTAGHLWYRHEYDTNSKEDIETDSSYVNAGTWYLLGIRRDISANTIDFIVDGDIKETKGFTNDPSGGSGAVLRFGAASSANGFIDGTIDDIRIYNRALSQAEITALYELYDVDIQVASTQKELVAHWDFNGDVKDRTPNDNHGTASGTTAVADRKSQADRARSFDGGDEYIDIGNDTSLDVGNVLTVAAWINPASLTARQGIFSTRNPDASGAFQLEVGPGNGGTNRVAVTTSGVWNLETDDNAISAGVWQHVVYTKAAAAGPQKLYVNGVEQSLATDNPQTFSDNTNPKQIGHGEGAGRQYFNGEIDEVRIYGRALSQAEITALYESYDGGIQVSDLQKGLVGYWSFDGDTKDRTPYSHHATASGTSPTTDRKAQSSKAYDFSGAGDVIYFADSDDFSFTVGNPFSVSLWISPDTSPDDYDGVIGKWDNQGDATKEWLFRFGAGDTWEFRLLDSDTNGSRGSSTTDTIPTGQWTHIVGTTDGAANPTTKIYINGVQKDAVAITSGSYDGMNNTVSKLYIGALENTVSGDSGFFDGKIDDVRIYSRALSATEVQMLYDSYR